MALSGEQSKISQALENSVMPWCARWGMGRTFVAAAQWQPGLALPDGMAAAPTPLRGPRMPVRSIRAYGGSAVVDATWPQDGVHSARTPKLCFVLTGPVVYRVADYVLHCKTGQSILLPPGVPFANGTQGYLDGALPHQDFCELLQLMPYHGGVICWRSENRKGAGGVLHKSEETCSIPHSAVTFYLNQLVNEATSAKSHRGVVCDGLLNITIALLHRELQALPVITTGTMGAGDDISSGERKEYSIEQAQTYIHNNLREPLSIDKVAYSVCMSRTTFTEQFRLRTGKTFTEYVIDLRFCEAKRILAGTDLAVRHVGSLVGLKPNRMRMLFQEREGISPTQYRQRNRVTSIKSG